LLQCVRSAVRAAVGRACHLSSTRFRPCSTRRAPLRALARVSRRWRQHPDADKSAVRLALLVAARQLRAQDRCTAALEAND
ncbi:MAG: hypothetical protein ACPIOQ_13055, partial [Promethearchaeia archaeon]